MMGQEPPKPLIGIIDLKIGQELSIYFRARMMLITGKIHGINIVKPCPIFIERVKDDDYMEVATLVPARLAEMPLEAHACIIAACTLIHHSEARHIIEESEHDVVVAPKAVIHAAAARYGVDPSEMMAHFPIIRNFLLHKRLQIPQTIEAAIHKIGAQSTVAMRKTLH